MQHGVFGAVGGEQQAVDAACGEGLLDVGAVAGVVAVRAVLVLDLYGDDRAAAAGEQRQQLGDDAVEPAVDLGLEAGVGAAQVQAVEGEEAGGQAAEVPFGADVGAGADDGVEAEAERRGSGTGRGRGGR